MIAKIKARILNPYIGVVKIQLKDIGMPIKTLSYPHVEKISDGYKDWVHILVKPLSSMTDEDVIQVCEIHNIEYTSSKDNETMWEFVENQLKHETLNFVTFQYLQSKGYAMPYMNYTVEDLIKHGIFKLV